jgi:hypothetical protein
MSNTSTDRTQESFYGEVISTYTRAQAIEDGVLVDAGSIALEAGFTGPVALTSAVWADCVAWSDGDSQKQVHQDQSARLWDLLYLAAYAVRASTGSGDRLLYERVPRDGHSTDAQPVTLKLIIGPGDHGEPVMTIMLVNED